MTRALAVIALLVAQTASADDASDANADHSAREANLESTASRQGVTFSAALGGGIILGNGVLDPVTDLSLHLGHVATAADVIELELTSGTYFRSLGNERLTDASTSALIGDQHYLAPAIWLRAAFGVNVHTVDNGPMGTTTRLGPAGAFGVGLDLLRRHLFVVGLESFAIVSLEHGGPLLTSVFGLNVSYY